MLFCTAYNEVCTTLDSYSSEYIHIRTGYYEITNTYKHITKYEKIYPI